MKSDLVHSVFVLIERGLILILKTVLPVNLVWLVTFARFVSLV